MEISLNTGKERKLIAYYGRVSTSNQEDQKTIQNQEMELNTLADERYGAGNYVVVRKYYDEGWSGDILARPHLDQLRQDAVTGMWDIVLIYDPDRLARRAHYQEVVLEELREAGKQIHFRTIKTPENSEDQIFFSMRGVFSQYERMRTAERFRIGKLRKARDKHIITSVAPYGYSLIPRKGKPRDPDFVETHLVINPVEARVVRMLFDWVANEGMTIRKVIRRLQQMNIKPRKNSNGVWGTTTLSTILKRETYIGRAHFGASFAVVPKKPWKKDVKYRKVKKTSRKMKPKDEWIQIPAPAILEGEEGKSLFARVQLQLKENRETSQRNKKNSYLLAERMRCVCGCSRTGEGPQQGKYLYYRCSNRVKSFPLPSTCKEKGINSRIADATVWSKLAELMGSHDLMREQIERWTKKQKMGADSDTTDIEALQTEIAKLKKQEARYNFAYGEGAFELGQLQTLTAPVKNRIADLDKQIAHANSQRVERKDDSTLSHDEVEKVNTEAKGLLKDLSFDQKRDIVLDVIERIVGVPGRLTVSGHLPVAIVSPIQYDFLVNGQPLYVKLKTSDRHCRAAECREVDAF